jgi:hypothetical protein
LLTEEFLDLILPADGWMALALPLAGGGFKHHWYSDTQAMAAAARGFDAKGLNVYMALAGFGEERNAEGRRLRTQTNVVALKAFWLDIDVGEGKPYAKASDALRDVVQFQQTLGLPQPYCVKSGRGLHIYWPLADDITPSEWKPIAEALKLAVAEFGLHADPSRTADHASVLRPIGTTNRKAGRDPSPVELKLLGSEVDPADMSLRLSAYLEVRGVALDQGADGLQLPAGGPAPAMASAINADLSDGLGGSLKFADAIANRCGIVALVRDTKGNVDQPTWFHTLGVLAFCEDGDAKAHEWSAGHPDYTVQETDRKLAQVRAKQTGPTLCSKLGQDQPALCKVCPHAGRIKTPAVLGMIQQQGSTPITPPAPLVVLSASSGSMQSPTAAAYPADFRWQMDIKMQRQTLQKCVSYDEVAKAYVFETFCLSEFRPISRVVHEGVAAIEFERKLPQNLGVERFVLTGSQIGKGKEAWAGPLGDNEIAIYGKNGAAHMDALLKRWMHQLTETAARVQTHTAFGWTEQGEFVLGDRVLQPGGRTSRAILSGVAKQMGPAFTPIGDVQVWANTVDQIYNAPGQEAYQFMVMCGFAAPLLRMLQKVDGLTVYAHSEGSGVGKTTAAQAALSIWGDPDDLQLSEGKATGNALWAIMGVNKSVPVLFDELTNMDPRTASELVFSVSSGRSKQRLKSDGELRQNNANWKTIMLATGNNLLSEKLAAHRANADAELSRLFEYTLRATPHLSPNDAATLVPLLASNHGVAGEVYIRYVIENYAAIETQLAQVRSAFTTQANISQKERFWSALMAAVLMSLSISNKLGLTRFDAKGLKAWMVERLQENRTVRVESAGNPLDVVGKMLNDLLPGVLVTLGEGDLRRVGGAASVLVRPMGALLGRAIQPTDPATQQRILMISDSAIRTWAVKNMVSARELIETAVAAGWMDATPMHYSLGKGTLEYSTSSSYIPVRKMFPDKMGAQSGGGDVLTRLQLVGGQDAAAGGRQ